MTYTNCVWDEKLGKQVEVEATPEDVAEIEARKTAPPSRDQLKATRQAKVEAITVTVNGKVFDGDEISQTRMARALTVASISGEKDCTWVLHDNQPAIVTKAELEQALALSLHAQAAMWVIQA